MRYRGGWFRNNGRWINRRRRRRESIVSVIIILRVRGEAASPRERAMISAMITGTTNSAHLRSGAIFTSMAGFITVKANNIATIFSFMIKQVAFLAGEDLTRIFNLNKKFAKAHKRRNMFLKAPKTKGAISIVDARAILNRGATVKFNGAKRCQTVCNCFIREFKRCIINSDKNTTSRTRSKIIIRSSAAGNKCRFLQKSVTKMIISESNISVSGRVTL